ncbi:hypothetical protein GOODEAATRI_005978 [Goodea atripinnis]|uniref:Uncharacterized protein n=1 Tax=Goodea atripinnis TaxID=208336 RepID=A0ABV0PBR2_9TELE
MALPALVHTAAANSTCRTVGHRIVAIPPSADILLRAFGGLAELSLYTLKSCICYRRMPEVPHKAFPFCNNVTYTALRQHCLVDGLVTEHLPWYTPNAAINCCLTAEGVFFSFSAKCLLFKCRIKFVVLKHFGVLPPRGIFPSHVSQDADFTSLTDGVKVPHGRHFV